MAYVIFQLPEFEFYLLCLDASESASQFHCTSSFIQQGFHPRPSLYERRPKVPSLVGRLFLEVQSRSSIWLSASLGLWKEIMRRVALPYRTCYSRTYSEAPLPEDPIATHLAQQVKHSHPLGGRSIECLLLCVQGARRSFVCERLDLLV